MRNLCFSLVQCDLFLLNIEYYYFRFSLRALTMIFILLQVFAKILFQFFYNINSLKKEIVFMDRDFNAINFSFSLRQQHSALLYFLKYMSSITGRKDLNNVWKESFSTWLYSNFIDFLSLKFYCLEGQNQIINCWKLNFLIFMSSNHFL